MSETIETVESANTAPEKPIEAFNTGSMSFGATVWVASLISIAVCTVALVGFHYFSPRPPRMATIDLNEIIQIKQVQLTALATKPGATDADRAASWDAVNAFGKNLEKTITELQRECGCTLLVRAAVIKGVSDDLTEALKKKLGMGGESLEAVIKSLSGQEKNRQMVPPYSLPNNPLNISE